jgi:ABC-type antimicrobial peptide transport system permease subunit
MNGPSSKPLAVGLLNQIYFLQRIPEYGILLALGYKVSYLVRRTLTEATVLTVTGWVLGLGVAYGAHWLLEAVLFAPKGITMVGLSLKTVSYTFPIPFLIAGFSLFTVIRRLMTLDPVSIVERRD